MARQILEQLCAADWRSADVDNIDLAEQYINFRSVVSQEDINLEGRVKKGLKRTIGDLKSSISNNRKELKSIEPKLRELEKEEGQLESERRCAFRIMTEGHLNRVGAPKVDLGALGLKEELTLTAVTLEAPAEAFNSLYEDLRSQRASLPEWICTPEAARLPERDLLGMCPGGKPHLTEEQLEAKKLGQCMCSICIPDRRLADVRRKLSKLKPRAQELRESIKEDGIMLSRSRRLVKRFRSGAQARDGDVDPVFYDDEEPLQEDDFEDEGGIVAHRRARASWENLQSTLQVTDFPLRIVFLDKSGSMGCDSVCYDALKLGLHNSLHPSRGSTLTFLFAAPGETQMVLRRPGDTPISFDFQLGCATWFNEPILRTLRFLAPLVEQLDTQAWIRKCGEPPLQVLCLTDGMDNCSSEEVRTLSGLVCELKDITGPVSGEKLYVPIQGPLEKHKALLDEGNKKVPVWLAWITCGMGGQSLLGSKTPKEICMVDAIAVPQLREPDTVTVEDDDEKAEDLEGDEKNKLPHCTSSTVASRARQRASGSVGNISASVDVMQTEWRVGHRVRVRAAGPGCAPKAALVLRTLHSDSKPQCELLFDDESTAIVDACQLLGTPAKLTSMLRLKPGQARPKGMQPESGVLSRTEDPDMQRLQVLSVVNAMTMDLASVMQKKSSKSNKVSLEGAVKFINGEGGIDEQEAAALETAVSTAQSSSNAFMVQEPPPIDPRDFLQEALLEIGRSSARLVPEDRIVSQRFITAGLEMLVCGGSLMPAYVSDQLGAFVDVVAANAQRRLPSRGDGEVEAWRKMVGQPLETLLCFMSKNGLLESQNSADGQLYLAKQDAKPCLAALWRYVDPSSNRSGFEDALRRAVNRFQRTRPSFSFGDSSSYPAARSSRPSILSHDPTAANSSETITSGLPSIAARRPSNGSLQSEPREWSRAASLTGRSPRSGSRCSTPGSNRSSGGSRPASPASLLRMSNCSTASGFSSASMRHSHSVPVSKASSSLFSAAGSSLIQGLRK